VCSSLYALGSMAHLDCDCLCCACCAHEHIEVNMKPQQVATAPQQPSGDMFAVGQEVRYRDRHSNLVPAVVVQVDRSIQPPQ
jgi:hypothetical protein